MAIHHPSQAATYFTTAFNTGDRAALLAYYTADAKLSLPGGQIHIGQSAIGQALEGFLALKGTMQLEPLYILEHGDTTLLRGSWRLEGKGPDGSPVVMEGSNIEVLRRQADGTWKCSIDAPFGGD